MPYLTNLTMGSNLALRLLKSATRQYHYQFRIKHEHHTVIQLMPITNKELPTIFSSFKRCDLKIELNIQTPDMNLNIVLQGSIGIVWKGNHPYDVTQL